MKKQNSNTNSDDVLIFGKKHLAFDIAPVIIPNKRRMDD